jgi:SAM-dependent methyltransferase
MDPSTFEPHSFDVIFSKDCFLYIHDKARIFNNIQRWLKPGGVFAFTDFGTCAKPTDESFLHHVAECNYALETPEGYEALLRGLGFENVAVADNTTDFLTRNRTDLEKFRAREQEFLKDYTPEDRDYIVFRWLHKIHWSEIGHLTQYAVVCAKAATSPQKP